MNLIQPEAPADMKEETRKRNYYLYAGRGSKIKTHRARRRVNPFAAKYKKASVILNE